MFEMDADLVSPAGLKPCFQKSRILKPFFHIEVAHRLSSGYRFDDDFTPVQGRTAKGFIALQLIMLDEALCDNPIGTFDGVKLELPR